MVRVNMLSCKRKCVHLVRFLRVNNLKNQENDLFFDKIVEFLTIYSFAEFFLAKYEYLAHKNRNKKQRFFTTQRWSFQTCVVFNFERWSMKFALHQSYLLVDYSLISTDT